MSEIVVIAFTFWIGFTIYKHGKSIGSRKGFNVGVRKSRRRRRRH